MHISTLWVTQRKLRNAGQIPAMVKAIQNGELLPQIELGRAEDGSIQVEDGHHRLTAYWLSGRITLEPQDFILVEKDRHRVRFGHIHDLTERVMAGLAGWITPKNEFVEAPKFEHMSVIAVDERMQPPCVRKALEDLEELEKACAADAARFGSAHAEWHTYEMASDRMSDRLWNLLMQEGYIRVCGEKDEIHFEGRPFAIKDKGQYCKEWADSFGCKAVFSPVKKDKS